MDELITSINELLASERAFDASVAAHYGLMSIQPFQDGNGRTGRLLADLILDLNGSSADGMVSINSKLQDNRGDYYQALDKVNHSRFDPTANIGEFTKFSIQIMSQAANDLKEKSIEFANRRDRFQSRFSGHLDNREIAGLINLDDLGPLPTSAYATLNGCSIPTARSDLRNLVDLGLVKQVGDGRQTRYEVSKVTKLILPMELPKSQARDEEDEPTA